MPAFVRFYDLTLPIWAPRLNMVDKQPLDQLRSGDSNDRRTLGLEQTGRCFGIVENSVTSAARLEHSMSSSKKTVICLALSTLLLIGCSGMQRHQQMCGQDAQNLKAWDDASEKFKACNAAWQKERRASTSVFSELALSPEDPAYFNKMTSKAPVSKAFKDALVKYRPQQLACRNELMKNIGDDNSAVRLMYKKSFEKLDQGMIDVLDGDLKTMGQVNQAYVAYINEANTAREGLHSRMKRAHCVVD